MDSTNKKLAALLVALIILLVVIIIMAIDIFTEDSSQNQQPVINNQVVTTQAPDFNQVQPNQTPQTPQQNGIADSTTVFTPDNNQPTAQSNNPSAMTNEQILTLLTNAMNKTKGYTANLSVYHKESFDAEVTSCTGGSLVAGIANQVVGMVLKPSDETLTFSNGTATSSAGETLTLMLPQKGQFRLKMEHIEAISATADPSGNTIVNVKLKPEFVDMKTAPAGNAAGVGYLDVSDVDVSIITISKADMSYLGSTISAHIRPDGYVAYAEYTIPVKVEGAAARGPIKGEAVFEGVQTEIWKVNW